MKFFAIGMFFHHVSSDVSKLGKHIRHMRAYGIFTTEYEHADNGVGSQLCV